MENFCLENFKSRRVDDRVDDRRRKIRKDSIQNREDSMIDYQNKSEKREREREIAISQKIPPGGKERRRFDF